jgi:hypothetical protein
MRRSSYDQSKPLMSRSELSVDDRESGSTFEEGCVSFEAADSPKRKDESSGSTTWLKAGPSVSPIRLNDRDDGLALEETVYHLPPDTYRRSSKPHLQASTHYVIVCLARCRGSDLQHGDHRRAHRSTQPYCGGSIVVYLLGYNSPRVRRVQLHACSGADPLGSETVPSSVCLCIIKSLVTNTAPAELSSPASLTAG